MLLEDVPDRFWHLSEDNHISEDITHQKIYVTERLPAPEHFPTYFTQLVGMRTYCRMGL